MHIGGPGIITRGYATRNIIVRGYTAFQKVIVVVGDAARMVYGGARSAARKTKDYVLEQWRRIAVYGKLAAKDNSYENLNQISGYEEHIVDNKAIFVESELESVTTVTESVEVEAEKVSIVREPIKVEVTGRIFKK